MKLFMTKYALSEGIKEVEEDAAYAGHYVDGVTRVRGYLSSYRFGTDIFKTREKAVLDAELRRDKKIINLKKKITKLEKMVF